MVMEKINLFVQLNCILLSFIEIYSHSINLFFAGKNTELYFSGWSGLAMLKFVYPEE